MLEKKDRPGLICKERERGGGGGNVTNIQTFIGYHLPLREMVDCSCLIFHTTPPHSD